MLNLSLRQLNAVRAVARTGRVNQAAQELGLTPPAVTLQIQQVELEVGGSIFDRTKAGLVPTELGLAVISGADDLHARMAALSDEIDALVHGRMGRVRMGVVSTAKYFAPAMIAAFQAAHPHIEIRLFVGNRAETITRIRQRALDVVIMGRPPRRIALEAAVIGDHPLVVIAPPDHPLARERMITKERLANELFLLRESGSGTRMALELYFTDVPAKMDNLGTEMGSNESIKQAVMAGLGVAMISAHTVAQEVHQGRLVVLAAEATPIVRQWFCITMTGRALTPAAAALRDFLISEGSDMLPRSTF
ncbi:LysR family transcriptional regulator [Sphingobium sp. LB126]|uniref:LysR family transcriptional regulator n=1 Tax=Sphingobium sp. LB126 TaxID=1983755 RepID=UPI000C20513A|nr:LysR family transcriptional regulator [Sphingobium sp. LB126]PJG47094.1 LysR family transcriptional regulator [Sphingobium sp. LB126]